LEEEIGKVFAKIIESFFKTQAKNVICQTIDFMKAKNFFLIPILFVLINACGNDKDKKKNETQTQAKDSTVAEEKLPSLEKEFADTLNAKPVKDSVLLKFNFQKGRTYHYTMSFDVNQKKGDQSRGSIMKWNYDMQVIDEKNKPVDGKGVISDNDRVWTFTPLDTWKSKRYKLKVDARLEDLAGNNLNKVFDRDITRQVRKDNPYYYLNFNIKP